MLTQEQKKQITLKFGSSEENTGSSEVQIALLSERIKGLTGHFKTHLKDHHSRRGLLGMVSKRRRLLNYLDRKHHQRYRKLISELQLRR